MRTLTIICDRCDTTIPNGEAKIITVQNDESSENKDVCQNCFIEIFDKVREEFS